MSDSFYSAFEDRHRGSRALIKSRLTAYLPFIRPLATLYPRGSGLDLGCGRGEWLELLGELGFDAAGVDLDEGMLAACRQQGLNARKADAIAALEALPAASMALVSAFHLVEHMPFVEVRSLVREALRVLKPGGLLILETPNPENLVVGASSFYMDPSHERPIPAELLDFVAEYAGFHHRKVVRLQESQALHAASAIDLHLVLYGVSADYSVVAQKDAAVEVLSGFDDAFRADYGISLGTLARYYDLQAEQRSADIRGSLTRAESLAAQQVEQTAKHIALILDRLGQAEDLSARAETQALQAEALAAQAEALAGQAEARSAEAIARSAQAEGHAAQLAAQLNALFQSHSWRMTAPLRAITTTYRRVTAAIREDRLISGVKRRGRSLLRRIGQAVLDRIWLRQLALGILNRVPGIKYRLKRVVLGPIPAPDATPTSASPSPLAPRTLRILAELKRAIAARKT